MLKNFFLLLLFLVCIELLHASTKVVGPTREFQRISDVVDLLEDGDTLLIDFATYIDDKQVTFFQNNLYISGINGRPILEAGPTIAGDISNGKAIFVTRGNHITIENLAFYNCKVQDKNGAGIRQEGCDLVIRNCRFYSNEMGILCGSIPNCKTTIEYCQFEGNGSIDNPGYQHNVYINHIDTLLFRFNESIDAVAQGHELKSRANYNLIAYNIIANRASEDSRNIDLSNGGTSLLIGNIVEQGPNSVNTNIIGYGLEGLTNEGPHNLVMVHNTIVNKKGRGSFVHVPNNGVDSLLLANNLFVGETPTFLIGEPKTFIEVGSVVEEDLAMVYFNDEANFDYRLSEGSFRVINKGVELQNYPWAIDPLFEIRSSSRISNRITDMLPDPGAYEYTISTSLETLVENELPIFFPNPTYGFLYTNEDIQDELTIYNGYGQKMPVNIINQAIDLTTFAQGIYLFNWGTQLIRIVKI